MSKKLTAASLKASSYNPRRISDKQLDMLGKAMKEFGDLSGVVVNVRTGSLIGGHQRLKHLDPSWEIIKEPEIDDTGSIAVGYILTPFGKWNYREVDWPEKKEKAANIAANQHGGEFDVPALSNLVLELNDGILDLDLLGFEQEKLGILLNLSALDLDEAQREGSGSEKENKTTCPKCGFSYAI